jgi:hypothetical protein
MASFEEGPLVEAVEHSGEDLNDYQEASGCGYGCFHVLGLRWGQGNGESKGLLEQKEDSWWGCKLRKMKEVSEVIAGPKWKTFIRKISVYGKKQQKNRFQYDEQSYALNFSSGAQSEDDDDDLPHSFSARFGAPFPSRRQSEL